MKAASFFGITLALLALSPAQAHPRHHHAQRHHYVHVAAGKPIQKEWYTGPAAMPHYAAGPFDDAHVVGSPQPSQAPFAEAVGRLIQSAGEILPHPPGCPSRAFCGCGAASYLGIQSRDLWLAANWFRFPRTQPGPGMAAVRRHHVMVIVSYQGSDRATVYDANSGRHMTRIHEVSLRGYTVVNPHGRRYARL